MDEKQRLIAAEEAAIAAHPESLPPPPCYATVEVSAETLEALHAPVELPAWVKRLPITLPFTHAAVAVPAAIFLARSLSEAVLLCSAVSFILISAATGSIARATRRDLRARNLAVHRLATAGAISLLWPLVALLVIGPAVHKGCHMKHHARPAGVRARPFQLSPAEALRIATPADPLADTVVFSYKGARVLLDDDEVTADDLAAQQLNEAVQALEAGGSVVISSKGVKSLVADDETTVVLQAVLDEQL